MPLVSASGSSVSSVSADDVVGGVRRLLHARDRRAREAATLLVVPAVAARVLAAGQAEVEGLVERVELVSDGGELLLAARLGHRLRERRVIREDEVLHPLAERAHLADPRSPRAADSNVYRVPHRSQNDSVRISVSVAPAEPVRKCPVSSPRAGPEYSPLLKPAPAAPWYRRTIAVRPGNGADRDPLVRWRAPWPCSPTSNASSNAIFERSTARLFRAHVQPVQLERRVERSMERARIEGRAAGPSSRGATACA